MEIVIVGLVLFLAVHLIPSFSNFRSALINSIGEKGYKAIFSLVSLISVVTIVYGFMGALDYSVYGPPSWGKGATFVLMFPAVYLFMSNSVASVPSSAQALSAHPLSWGVVLWSLAHLASNGTAPEVLIFATFLLFGVVSIITGNKRSKKPRKDIRPPLSKELCFLIVVALVYGALAWGHVYFTGINAI